MSQFDNVTGVPTSTASGVHPYAASASGGASFASTTSSKFDSTPTTTAEVRAKEQELSAREASLRAREEELTRKESALGIKPNNFPPFFPLIYHDIGEEIPDYAHYIQRPAFFSWLGLITCVICNFIAVLIAWASGCLGGSGVGSFFVSVVILLLGVPLSYIFWYRRLYNALRKDSGIGMGVFFCGYSVHIIFSCYCAVAPPFLFSGYGIAGVMTTISNFANNSPVAGIAYLIVAAMFIAESLLSIYVLGQAFAYFRGKGKGNQARREVAMAAITGSRVQV